jgi:hypothetical protein
MRHLTVVRSAALAVVVTLFSACSSDSTGPDYDDTFTAGDAMLQAEGVAGGSEQMMETMHWGYPQLGIFAAPSFVRAIPGGVPERRHPSRLPLPAAGAPLGAHLTALQAAAPGCTVSGHGAEGGDPFQPYDGNDNGVGDDFYVKADCTWVEEIGEGVTVTYKEGQEMRIKERTGVLWGWDASIRIWSSDVRSDGVDNDKLTIELAERLAITASRAEYGQKVRFAQEGMDGDLPYRSDDGADVTAVFTAASDPIVFDLIFPAGTVTLSGRLWSTDLEGPDHSWHIVTDDPLVWSAGCAEEFGQPFVDGEIEVLLNGDEEKGFALDANECEDGWDLEIFGDEVPVPTTRGLQVRGFTLPRR